MANEEERNRKNQSEVLRRWISRMPLTKPTKNLSRDFADAVMMAEVLKVYFPRLVDVHNYAPANSFTSKKENWELLNRKVLSKVDMKLSKEVIGQLASCQPNAVETVLLELRKKVSKDSDEDEHPSRDGEEARSDGGGDKAGQYAEDTTTCVAAEKLDSCPVDKEASRTTLRKCTALKYLAECFRSFVKVLTSWFWVWMYFSHTPLGLVTIFRNSLEEATLETRGPSRNIDEERVKLCLDDCAQKLDQFDNIIASINEKIECIADGVEPRD